MIKSFTAFTSEIDDVDTAVSEIVKQLDPEKNCRTHTAGIVTCYHEYATSGIIAELYKRLKFPIIGTATSALATNHNVGQLDLAIMMITSDDVTFTSACSSPLSNELEGPLTQMYQSALSGHNQPPKLILSAAPLLLNYAGDHYVEALNRASGGVPNFGSLSVDDSGFDHCLVIYNDRFAKDIYSVIVASGNIEPIFIYESFSPECILSQAAIITKASGNLLKEVNGIPFINYLEVIGLACNGKINDLPHSIPLILDYTGEGIPVSRVLWSWNEDGGGVCGGIMPEGTKFNIGTWDKSDVIATTTRTLEKIMGHEISALLLYSCNSRSYILGTDIFLEADKVNEILAGRIPYLFAYSGGEICPVSNSINTNSFHNNTVIACAF